MGVDLDLLINPVKGILMIGWEGVSISVKKQECFEFVFIVRHR